MLYGLVEVSEIRYNTGRNLSIVHFEKRHEQLNSLLPSLSAVDTASEVSSTTSRISMVRLVAGYVVREENQDSWCAIVVFGLVLFECLVKLYSVKFGVLFLETFL